MAVESVNGNTRTTANHMHDVNTVSGKCLRIFETGSRITWRDYNDEIDRGHFVTVALDLTKIHIHWKRTVIDAPPVHSILQHRSVLLETY